MSEIDNSIASYGQTNANALLATTQAWDQENYSHNGIFVPVGSLEDFTPVGWRDWQTKALLPMLREDEVALKALKLTKSDYVTFLWFVGHPFDYNYSLDGQSFRCAPRRAALTHHSLVRHLRGEHVIGTGARWNPSAGDSGRVQTNFFAIDIDAGADRNARYDAIVRVFGLPSAVFQSSESGGIHAYYFLTKPIDLYRLRSRDGSSGACVKLMKAAGLKESGGAIELYPCGQDKSGRHGNRLRRNANRLKNSRPRRNGRRI